MRTCTRGALNLVLAGVFALQCLPFQSIYGATTESERPARATPRPVELTVATFNIKWYGLGGTLGGTGAAEKRDPNLKEFIAKELGSADVIVFEEIVDLPRLEKNVLGTKKFKCQSYDNNNPKHQKVAICWNKKYKLQHSPGEDAFIWADVMMGRHRPAVVGTLATASGKPLLQIVGVHLKAMPGFSSIRAEQAKLISAHLAAQETKIPTVITGDFNTFNSDESLIQAALDDAQDGYTHIDFPDAYTFRSGDMASKFDRFWVSQSVEAVSVPKVWKACNHDAERTPAAQPTEDSPTGSDPYENISYYNKHISDHCPVIVKVRVPSF